MPAMGPTGARFVGRIPAMAVAVFGCVARHVAVLGVLPLKACIFPHKPIQEGRAKVSF